MRPPAQLSMRSKQIRAPIEILINNAGMKHRGPLEDFAPEDFERLVATNVTSVFNVGQAAARHMIRRGEGKIINMASVQTALARPGIAPYVASKGGVANLTKGMATDWVPKGLNINAIAPGYFDTPLNAALVADEDFTAWIHAAGALGAVARACRRCGVPLVFRLQLCERPDTVRGRRNDRLPLTIAPTWPL